MKIINITAEIGLEQVAEDLQKIAVNSPHSVAILDGEKNILIEFEGVEFSNCSTSEYNGIPTVTYTFSDDKLNIESRVEALEESQEIQDGALEDIGMVLSDMAEG